MKISVFYLAILWAVLLSINTNLNAQSAPLTWRLIKEPVESGGRAKKAKNQPVTINGSSTLVYQSSDNKYRARCSTQVLVTITDSSIIYAYDTSVVFYELAKGTLASKPVSATHNKQLLQTFLPYRYKSTGKETEIAPADLGISEDKPDVTIDKNAIKVHSEYEIDTVIKHLGRLKTQYNSLYAVENNHSHISFLGGATPSFGLRQLSVSNPQFTHVQDHEQRIRNESYAFSYVFSAGIMLGHYSHSFTAQYLYAQQAFANNNTQPVDLNTGLLGSGNKQSVYLYHAQGFSVGYDYRTYHPASALFVSADIYYLHIIGNSANYGSVTNVNSNIAGFKLAPGFSYRPVHWFEMRVGPALYYNFTYFNKATEINTRFINMGLEAKVLLNIPVVHPHPHFIHELDLPSPEWPVDESVTTSGSGGSSDAGGASGAATTKATPPGKLPTPPTEPTNRDIRLSQLLKDPKMEFSGIAASGNDVYLLPQKTIKNGRGLIYKTSLYIMETMPDKNSKAAGELAAEKLEVKNINIGDDLEPGFEAIAIHGSDVFLTVECDTPHDDYLLKGTISGNTITITSQAVLPKYKPAVGDYIDNAGYESVGLVNDGKQVLAIFEYNNLDTAIAYLFDTANLSKRTKVKMHKTEHRITDITSIGNNTFTAINFQFKSDDPRYVNDEKPVAYFGLLQLNYDDANKVITVTQLPAYSNADTANLNFEGILDTKEGYWMVSDENSKGSETTIRYVAKIPAEQPKK